MKLYVGIDNGVSGSIGLISKTEKIIFKTPAKLEQSYTKKKQNISRINFKVLYRRFAELKNDNKNIICLVERPMVNPTRFKASASALRSLEATLIIIEELGMPFQYIDSKQWQKVMLPQGIKGSAGLKKASSEIGIRLFPEFIKFIEKHGDADGILIAEWARRLNL